MHHHPKCSAGDHDGLCSHTDEHGHSEVFFDDGSSTEERHHFIPDEVPTNPHRLERIESQLSHLLHNQEVLMSAQQQAIDESIAATAKLTAVVPSIVAALNGIPQRINDAIAAFVAANPTVDVSGLTTATSAELANVQAIANAVVANTPAAPAPAPAPTTP